MHLESQSETKEEQDRKNVASLLPNILTALEVVESGVACYINTFEDLQTSTDTVTDLNEGERNDNGDRNYVTAMRPLQFGKTLIFIFD